VFHVLSTTAKIALTLSTDPDDASLAAAGSDEDKAVTPRRLLLLSLRVSVQLLESLPSESSLRSTAGCGEEVTHGSTAVRSAIFGFVDAAACAQGQTESTVLDKLAEALAGGSFGDLVSGSSGDLCRVLARITCALLSHRIRGWPDKDKASWLGRFLGRLVGQQLECSVAENASDAEGSTRTVCCLSLPCPLGLLSCDRASVDATHFEGLQRSLRALIALLQAGCSSPAAAAVLQRTVTLSPDGRGEVSAQPMNRVIERLGAGSDIVAPAISAAGLVLSVVAQGLELGRSEVDRISDRVGTLLSDRCHAVWLAGSVLKVFKARPWQLGIGTCAEIASSTSAARGELWTGLGNLMSALCAAPWSDEQGDELWDNFVEILGDWSEFAGNALASGIHSGSATEGSPAPTPVASMQSLALLCAGVGRGRRENLLGLLAMRLSALAAWAAGEHGEAWLPRMSGTAEVLAVLIQGLPQRPTLPGRIVSSMLAAVHAAVVVMSGSLGSFPAVASLHVARISIGLYLHLAAPLHFTSSFSSASSKGLTTKRPHVCLADAEDVLLHIAGLQTRASLHFLRARSVEAHQQAATAMELLSSAYSALSAIFSSVPSETTKLPPWTRKPHVVLDILKAMLEAVYTATSGRDAARVAGDVARLWEAYAQGGTRLVAQSAGRAGKATHQAKIQRATKGFVIMLIAHALDQQRLWAGVEAAVKRSLIRLDAGSHATTRSIETVSWKEAVCVLQTGMVSLFACLDGSDHLKQALYASLREPLGTMFKELHEGYQKRSKYTGEA